MGRGTGSVEGDEGAALLVRAARLSHCSQLQYSALVASTPPPALTGIQSFPDGGVLGGCSPAHLMWDIVTRGHGIPHHQVAPVSGALQFRVFCPLRCLWGVPWVRTEPRSWNSHGPTQQGGARLFGTFSFTPRRRFTGCNFPQI